jgi:cell division control protein 24
MRVADEQKLEGLSSPELLTPSSTHPSLFSISSSQYETDLEASRVYRRVHRDTMDFSMRSSVAYSRAWSVFTGLSLSQISAISAIALPLYPEDISNPQHYNATGNSNPLESVHDREESRSIFHDCIEAELQLSQLSGFKEIFASVRETDEDIDPLALLVRVFREGGPLVMLYDAFDDRLRRQLTSSPRYYDGIDRILQCNPNGTEWPGNTSVPLATVKLTVYRFIEACLENLEVPPDSCFQLDDLFGDRISGHLKVGAHPAPLP